MAMSSTFPAAGGCYPSEFGERRDVHGVRVDIADAVGVVGAEDAHEATLAPAGAPRVLDDPVGSITRHRLQLRSRRLRAALLRVGFVGCTTSARLLLNVSVFRWLANYRAWHLDFLVSGAFFGAGADDDDAVVVMCVVIVPGDV